MTKEIRLFLALLLLTLSKSLFAQDPSLDFLSPAQVCFEGNVKVQNNSNNLHSFEWDFCEGDLGLNNVQVNTFEASGLNIPIGTSLLRVRKKWYGFVTSLSGNELFRIDFGESLKEAQPVVTNLGNPGGVLHGPQDIKVIESHGKFYAFISNRFSKKLVRINFGENIENSFLSSNVLLTGAGFVNGGLDVTFDGVSWIVSITNSNYLTFINLGDSPATIPTSNQIANTSAIPGIDGIGDVKFIKENSNWYGFVVGFNSRTLHRLHFGSNLFSNPVAYKLNVSGLGNFQPYGLVVEKENGEFFVFSATGQGNFIRLSLGDNVENNGPAFTDLGKFQTFENTLKIDFLRSASRWVGLTANWNSKKFYLLQFPQADCPFDKPFSLVDAPIVKAIKSGEHTVSLFGKGINSLVQSTSKNIVVQQQKAPQVKFDTVYCITSVNSLVAENTSLDQTVTSYTWTLPDGSQQFSKEASYHFQEPGKYNVRLEVESSNSCGNFIEKAVAVYPEPQANFSLSASQICTNSPIFFSNLTIFPEESVITFNWNFGDGNTSTNKNPEYTFKDAGIYQVVLSASIPGCTATFSKTVEVQTGPQTLFEAKPVCDGQKVIFQNLTSGDNITSYEWDLGDGTFSSLENPDHVYDFPGNYLVHLSTTNDLGCVTSSVQTVRVSSQPSPDFIAGPSCAGSETYFTDNSTDEDGNIVAWHWQFEQPDGTLLIKEEQNPIVTFDQPGSYEVVLTTTTNWLCQQTVLKTIIVDPVPEVAIRLEGGCLGVPSVLADVSEPGALKVQSWYWRIGEEVFTDSAFSYTFPEAGTYEIFLQLNLENGCSVKDTQQIVVDPLPQVDFSWSGTCPGQTAFFQSTFSAGTYEWILDGQLVSTAVGFEHTFEAVGIHHLQLTVQNEKGCTNIISKEIEVVTAPVAAFSAGRAKGVAPFSVQFTNSSQGGEAYQWFFGDAQQSSSSLENPFFTFGETQDYVVKLVTYNAAGCTDTTMQLISVVEGKYDVVLSAINLLQQNGQVQLVLGLENAGTIAVNNMEITVLVNNEYALSERFNGNLEMGQQENYSLNMQLLENSKRKLRFVCVELKPVLTLVSEEFSVTNNKLCLSFDNFFVMHEPYPNPGQDIVTLEYLLPHTGTVNVSIFSAQGKLVRQAELQNQKAGLSQYQFQLDGLGKGIYFVKARFGGEEVNYRIMKD